MLGHDVAMFPRKFNDFVDGFFGFTMVYFPNNTRLVGQMFMIFMLPEPSHVVWVVIVLVVLVVVMLVV